MKKLKKKAKPTYTFRIWPDLAECLNLLIENPGIIDLSPDEKMNGADWIQLFAWSFLKESLSKQINPAQITTYASTDGIFGLFIMYAKATKGEKGFSFTCKDKAKRFVVFTDSK